MVHKCAEWCRNKKTGLCNAHFPFALNPRTYEDSFGFIQHARTRPSTADECGDEWVVQYNRHILHMWDGSANVQIAHTVRLIFYLFKYLFKGNDYVRFEIQKAKEAGVPIDEYDLFQKGRYISATEACWRIFEFHTSGISPPVSEIPVHTEGEAYIFFKTQRGENERRTHELTNTEAEKAAKFKDSLLEHYFMRPDVSMTLRYDLYRSGKIHELAGTKVRLRDLLYAEYFDNFTVSPTKPSTKGIAKPELAQDRHFNPHWVYPFGGCQARTKQSVHRIRFVYPNNLETFALRQILLRKPVFSDAPSVPYGEPLPPHLAHLRTGYEDGRYHDGVQHDSYQKAALAMGLLHDSLSHCSAVFDDIIANHLSPYELRFAFVLLLAYDGFPACAIIENQEYRRALAADFHNDIVREQPHLAPADAESKAYQALLEDLSDRLLQFGKTMKACGLPEPERRTDEYEHWSPSHPSTYYQHLAACRLLDTLPADIRPDPDDSSTFERPTETFSLNAGQRSVYDEVLKAALENKPAQFYLDGKSGSGKTTLIRALTARLRLEQYTVLNCASTGIAALLQEGGGTAHSLFHIPVSDDDVIACNLSPGKERARLIRDAKLIIWDEFPMSHRKGVEAVDRALREICKAPSKPFGGKTVLFAGDFRQIPPVVEAGGKFDIILASVRSSPLWHEVLIRQLTRPERELDAVHADVVHRIGAGTYPTTHKSSNGYRLIHLSHLRTETEIEPTIDFAFPDLTNPYECSQRAILTTKNATMREVNDLITERLPGESRTYLSADTIDMAELCDEDGDAHGLHDALTTEFLNTLDHNGAPPHELTVKKGMVLILLRNLSRRDGLMNNSKVELIAFSKKYLRVRTLHADPQRRRTYAIPRIDFTWKLPRCGVAVKRRQFPVLPAYAVTFNKSQGQTLQKVVLDLRNDCFAHGQLYVALGRVRRGGDLLVLTDHNRLVDGGFVTRNVVWPELFLHKGHLPPIDDSTLTEVQCAVTQHTTGARGKRLRTGDPDTLTGATGDSSHFSALARPYDIWARNLADWFRKSPDAVLPESDIRAFAKAFNAAALSSHQLPFPDASPLPGNATFRAILHGVAEQRDSPPGFVLRDCFRKVCRANCPCFTMLHAHPTALRRTQARKPKPPQKNTGAVPEPPAPDPPHAAPCDRCDETGHRTEHCPHFTLPRYLCADSMENFGRKVAAALRPLEDAAISLPSSTARVPMPGDNSCMFHSVLFMLNADYPQLTVPLLREYIATEVLADPDSAMPLMPALGCTIAGFIAQERGPACTPGVYAHQIRQRNTWGGSFDLVLLAEGFNLELFVHMQEQAGMAYVNVQHIRPTVIDRTLHITYTGTHYDVLLPGDEL